MAFHFMEIGAIPKPEPFRERPLAPGEFREFPEQAGPSWNQAPQENLLVPMYSTGATGEALPAGSSRPSGKKGKARKGVKRAKPAGESACPSGKRAPSNPDNWIQNIRKKARESGQEYVSRNGKVQSQRAMKPPCGESCRKGCREALTEEERHFIFKRFWSFDDNEKRFFLAKFTKRVETKRKTSKDSSRRQYTFKYFLEMNNTTYSVCQTFFLNTLDISSARIYHFFEHNLFPDGMPMKVQRQRNRGPKYTEEDLARVREHIRSFPVVAHCNKASCTKRYLDSKLTVTQMHQLYEQSPLATDHQVPVATYRKVFNTEFNLAFKRLPKDKCAKTKRKNQHS